jgi:hypothetical protein
MEFNIFTYKTKSKNTYALIFLKILKLIFIGNVNFKPTKSNISETF